MGLRPTSAPEDRYAPATSLTVDDMAHVEAAVPGLHVTRLDRGRAPAELTLIGVGGSDLCVGRFDFRVSTEGGVGDDELRIALQLEPGAGSWNGSAFDPDRVWVYGPGAEHVGAAGPHRAGRGATWATFALPVEAAARSSRFGDVGRRGRLSILDADTRELRRTLRDVLDEGRARRLTFDQARQAGRELNEATAALVLDAEDATMRVPSAHEVTRRCLQVADDLHPIPTTAELASALDISDRWVRSSFVRVYGVSVSAFFRARSLHRARRALATADPASVSVAQVATACGFWHLGRFSGYYREHFGEYPRATLRRTA